MNNVIRIIATAAGGLIAALAFAQTAPSTEPAVALLSQKCLACHNDKQLSSGLSIETRSSVLAGGNRGAAVVPGKPQDSLIVTAIRQTGALKMPPTGKLTDAEIGVIEQWIAAGAPGLKQSARAVSNHWAFQAPKRPAEPPVRQTAWARTPIDHFILARLEKEGLRPSPADRSRCCACTRIDRTRSSPQRLTEFSRYTRRLRANGQNCSPRHTMGNDGAHWLDQARYADSVQEARPRQRLPQIPRCSDSGADKGHAG